MIFSAIVIRLETVPDSKLDAIDLIVNIAVKSFVIQACDDKLVGIGYRGRVILINFKNPSAFLNVVDVGISLDVIVVPEQVQDILDIEEYLECMILVSPSPG